MKWLAAFPRVTTCPPPISHSFPIKDVLRGSSTILICSFKILSGFFAQFSSESFPPQLFALSRGGIVILAHVEKKNLTSN